MLAGSRRFAAGDTFITVGPLIEMTVDGHRPGETLELAAGGGTVIVEWRVESASIPIQRIEIVVGGYAEEAFEVEALASSGSTSIRLVGSSWIALRVRGSFSGRREDIAAHTSAVQAIVGGQPVFVPNEAAAVLDQIEGALAYVDTLAPRETVDELKRVRASLEAAHRRLHAACMQGDCTIITPPCITTIGQESTRPGVPCDRLGHRGTDRRQVWLLPSRRAFSMTESRSASRVGLYPASVNEGVRS